MSDHDIHDVAVVSSRMYELLKPLASAERQRAVHGTMVLLGEHFPTGSLPASGRESKGGGSQGSEKATAKEFFDQKQPNSKVEELAVAARYREVHEEAENHTKDDFESVIKAARRNFDAKNFNRDIDTGRTQGYFNRGGNTTAGYSLSYYGQNYTDQLPNRDAARALKRPKGSGKSKRGSAVEGRAKQKSRT